MIEIITHWGKGEGVNVDESAKKVPRVVTALLLLLILLLVIVTRHGDRDTQRGNLGD